MKLDIPGSKKTVDRIDLSEMDVVEIVNRDGDCIRRNEWIKFSTGERINVGDKVKCCEPSGYSLKVDGVVDSINFVFFYIGLHAVSIRDFKEHHLNKCIVNNNKTGYDISSDKIINKL